MAHRLLRSAIIGVVCALATLALGGCAQTSADSAAAKPAYGDAVADQPTNALASATADGPDYRIAARDIIDVTVFQVPDLTKQVQVSDDGHVTLPLIGKIALLNKTTQEAETIIADKLRKTYMRSPQVSVFVRQYGQRVTVSGEVKNPRVMPLDGKVTLTQAVAGAGGVSDLGDSKRVHIARTINRRIRDDVYNLDDIQAGKGVDPMLQGGDLVVVEQSGIKVAFKNVKDLLPFAILAPLL